MNKMKFYRMDNDPPYKKEFTFDGMDYYSITLDGYLLMYATNKYRPDGMRLYILGDELAKYLGFCDIKSMMKTIRLQWWRGKLSPKSIKRRFS